METRFILIVCVVSDPAPFHISSVIGSLNEMPFSDDYIPFSKYHNLSPPICPPSMSSPISLIPTTVAFGSGENQTKNTHLRLSSQFVSLLKSCIPLLPTMLCSALCSQRHISALHRPNATTVCSYMTPIASVYSICDSDTFVLTFAASPFVLPHRPTTTQMKISHRNQFRCHFIQLVYKKTSRYNSGMFWCKETRIIINSCCSICLEDDGISVSTLPYVFQCQCQYIVHKKCFDEWLAREPRCLICDTR